METPAVAEPLSAPCGTEGRFHIFYSQQDFKGKVQMALRMIPDGCRSVGLQIWCQPGVKYFIEGTCVIAMKAMVGRGGQGRSPEYLGLLQRSLK